MSSIPDTRFPPVWSRHSSYHYGMAIAYTLLALGLSMLAAPITTESPLLLFVGAVTLSAWRGGAKPGLLSAALSVVLSDYFLIEPLYTFFAIPSDLLQFLLFVLLALLISWLEENRRHSQAALQNARMELHTILNSIGDGITAHDAGGTLRFANEAALLSGLANPLVLTAGDTAVPQRFQLFEASGQPLPMTNLPQRQAFRTGQTAHLDYQLHDKETHEDRWISLSSTPVKDAEGAVRMVVNVFKDRTQQVENERIAAELASIVQNTQDAIIGKKLDGTITSWNPGAERLYGYKASEIVGKTIFDLIEPDVFEYEKPLFMSLLDGEHLVNHETTRIHKDGHIIEVALTASPIRSGNGNISGYSTIERDISERRKLEQMRAENTRFLRNILNSLPIMVGVLDPQGALVEVNQSALNFAHTDADAILGKPFVAGQWWAHLPEARQKFEDAFKRAQAGETLRYDTQIHVGEHLDEMRLADIHFMISPMYNAQGELSYLIPAALDISERKEREREILRLTLMVDAQRRRLDRIVASVPGIVYLGKSNRDSDSQEMEFISAYAEKMLGYTPEKWKRAPEFWQKVVHPDDWDALLEEANMPGYDTIVNPLSFRCITADGRIRYAEAYHTIIQDDQGNVNTCGIVMDVTERHNIEQELAKYAEELQRSNDELEQFAYVASHDLQEPLRMVTSYLQLIEQRYADKLDKDGHEFIHYAVDGASRMKTLIQDLLTYSRVQRSKIEFEFLDIQDTLEQALLVLSLRIEDSQAEITYDPLPELQGNSAQMIQLFQNLIGNAIKFRSDDTPKVHISAKQKGRYYCFSVRDNGIGIEEAYQKRIFVLFQRLHAREEYEGTGLGLTICKKIVENHGGRIWVKSQPGEGTTFYFNIPVNQPQRIV